MKHSKCKFLFALLFIITLFFNSDDPLHAQTFTFGAAGDFANSTNFRATVEQVRIANPAFMIALGDFAYAPAEQSWCNTWKTAGVNNILLIGGNHDEGQIDTYNQFCPYTLTSQLTGRYGKEYYFDYPTGNPIARFILISPGLSGSGYSGLNTNYVAGSTGYNFVVNAIDSARASGIKWVIVAEHKNYISALVKRNETGPDLINMLINKRVDLILQGHEHAYERSKQLTCARIDTYDASCVADSDNNLIKGAGSIIHIIGTGGSGLRAIYPEGDSERPYFATIDNTTHGFGKYTVSPTSINFQFIASARGNYTDSFTISGGGTVPSPSGNTNILQTVDVNSDRVINVIDIGVIVDNYGVNPIANTRADVNRDSAVNIIDIGMVIDYYGRTY